MKWIIHLFLVGTPFGQMTLSEEDAISLTNNIKLLQFEVDSLSKIVLYQDSLFDIYKGKSVADDSLKFLYELISIFRELYPNCDILIVCFPQ